MLDKRGGVDTFDRVVFSPYLFSRSKASSNIELSKEYISWARCSSYCVVFFRLHRVFRWKWLILIVFFFYFPVLHHHDSGHFYVCLPSLSLTLSLFKFSHFYFYLTKFMSEQYKRRKSYIYLHKCSLSGHTRKGPKIRKLRISIYQYNIYWKYPYNT